MTERIEIDYNQLQKVQQILSSRLDDLEQQYNLLRAKSEDLRQIWKGKASTTFFNAMETQAMPGMQRLGEALFKTHDVLSQVATLMRVAEEQAGNLFKGENAGGMNMGGGGAGSFAQGSENAGYSGGFTAQDLIFGSTRLKMADYPHSLFPSKAQIEKMRAEGKITEEQAKRMLKVAPKSSTFSNLVKIEGKLYEQQLYKGDVAAYEAAIGNENANIRVSALSAEAEVRARAKVTKDGIDVGVEARGGVYLARAQARAEYNGLKAVGDAYVGATASVQAGVVINPLEGDIKFVAKGEAFAGAEAKGSMGYSNSYFSVDVEGSAAAGAGARGQFDVGFEDGKFNMEIGFLASLGIGGGAGVKVNIDVYKVADAVADSVVDAFTGPSLVERVNMAIMEKTRSESIDPWTGKPLN